jgi:hypothetical protein
VARSDAKPNGPSGTGARNGARDFAGLEGVPVLVPAAPSVPELAGSTAAAGPPTSGKDAVVLPGCGTSITTTDFTCSSRRSLKWLANWLDDLVVFAFRPADVARWCFVGTGGFAAGAAAARREVAALSVRAG